MLWNELNNPAHWHGGRPGRDPWRIEDPDWELGLRMIADAAAAMRERFPHVERVFPGLSPMDAAFLELAADRGALADFDALAGHNFWLDFGPPSERGECGLNEFATATAGYRDVARRRVGRELPIVFSEVGVTSFAGDELQAWAAEKTLRTLEGIINRLPSTRATWYSLFDLPEEYMVTSLYQPDSHGEVRHRKFGLFRHLDGRWRPKQAAGAFARRRHPEQIGITQWFRMPWADEAVGLTPAKAHELSYRALEAAPPLLRELEVKWLRMNITWCDWHCATAGELENGMQWFDDLISALSEFRLLVTVFQAPPQLVRDPEAYVAGSVVRPEHAGGFRDTVLQLLDRYAPRGGAADASGIGASLQG